MRLKILLVLLSMALVGCATKLEAVPPPARYPELDSALAAPCALPAGPALPDYDEWQAWVEGPLMRAFADCAIRHRETVAAWPREPNQRP